MIKNIYKSLGTLVFSFSLVFAFTSAVFSMSKDMSLTIKDSDKSTSFSRVLQKYDQLKAKTKSSRRDFETQVKFSERLVKAEASLTDFISRSYRVSINPDSSDLDWENAMMIYHVKFPAVVLRKRGRGTPTDDLRISAPLSPEKVRIAQTFANTTVVDLEFKLTRQKQIMINSIKITLNGETIYEE